MSKMITLNADAQTVQYLCKKDKRLAKVISVIGPITYKLCEDDPYGFIIREIIEQMLSVKAGEKIFARLSDLCGGEVKPEKIVTFTREQIRAAGTSSSKADYILGITQNVLDGVLNFKELSAMDDTALIKKLTSIRGIGNWSAKMYMIFVLNRQDILPYEDITFLNAYKWLYKTDDITTASIKQRCEKWKPYSSIAARYLYKAFDKGLTKKAFHLYK